MSLIAVNVSEPEAIGVRRGRPVSSAIRKRPVHTENIRRDPLHLAGDRQADLRVHRGVDKAVYAYPAEHLATWSHELGSDPPLAPGAFGENLTTTGGGSSTLTLSSSSARLTGTCPPTASCENARMGFPLRFHVLLLPNVDWNELRARVLWLEDLGMEVAALADHFVDWTNPPAPWFEAWTSLAALAEATQEIRLMTAVSQIPLRNPAMLAREILTLDHISRGRLELGLGTGLTIDPSYAMAGLPNWSPAERVDRFAEYIELVSRLLTQETTTYRGRYYQVEGAFMNPRPVQTPRPAIMVAALGPRMMRLAARFADSWNSLSFQPSFDDQLAETAARCAAIDAACVAIGRDPETLRRSYTMFDTEARHRGGAIGYYASRERFRAQVERVIALGISDVGLYFPIDPAQRDLFEAIAVDELPALRGRYRSI